MAKNGLFLFVYGVIIFDTITARTCIESLDSNSDIYIEYGNSLNLTCAINEETLQAINETINESLYFAKNGQQISDNKTEILNSSSIGLFIEKPLKSKSVYACIMADDPSNAVCSNTIIVDSKPTPVSDFKCISYNLEALTCNWTPIESFAEINYEINHYFYIRRGRIKRVCPELIFNDSKKTMSCTWTIITEPQYRQAYMGTFHFELIMTNVFGTTAIKKDVFHYAMVLPNAPESLESIKQTQKSIYLRWFVPMELGSCSIQLQHKIMYRSQYENTDWQLADIIETKGPISEMDVYFNLTELKYAYAVYDIRVALRSSHADKNDDAMWSKTSSVRTRTMARIPSAPPRTNRGSFQIASASSDNRETLYIYWQQIKDENKNGGDFKYVIDNNQGVRGVAGPKKSYVMFTDIIIDESLDFLVWSTNEVGSSTKKSIAHIPKPSKRIENPVWFTQTEFSNGYYSLYWEMGTNNETIESYTVFWCTNDLELPYQCEGYLDWVELPRNQTSYNITLDVPQGNVTQFAISVNSETSSSGMLWASPIVFGKTISKVRDVSVNAVSSTSVKIKWRLQYTDGIASVKDFFVYYCKIPNESNSTCLGLENKVTISGNLIMNSIDVTGLEVNHTYKFAFSVLNRNDVESLKSNYQIATTLEGPPNPPANLTVINVTNSSIFIAWKKTDSNNRLYNYKIKFNNGKADAIIEDTSYYEEYNLTNLNSYTDYSFVIQTCTSTDCSEDSDVLKVRTMGGLPSRPTQPRMRHSNDGTDCNIVWKPPKVANGNNGTFQMRLQRDGGGTLINVTGTQHIIENCNQCEVLNISVRALNILEDGIFYGPWSEALILSCEIASVWLWALIPIVFLLLLLFIYKLRQLYFCYREMRKVEMVLPPGIESILDSDLQRDYSRKSRNRNQTVRNSADGNLYEIMQLLNKDLSECDNKESDAVLLNVVGERQNQRGSVPSSDGIMDEDNFVETNNINSSAITSTSNNNYCSLGSVPLKKDVNPNYVSVAALQEMLPKEENNSPNASNSTTGYVKAGDLNYLLHSDRLS